MPLAPSMRALFVVTAVLAGACRPVSVVIDCPPSVEPATAFEVVVTVEKSGGDTEFDIGFSWSSPVNYGADIVFLAVDDEVLDPPEESNYLDVTRPEGDVTLTCEGVACPDPDGACWGTLNVQAQAVQGGPFGADTESDACIIDLTAGEVPPN